MFDFVRFVERHGVAYSPAGPDNIVVHCPFCGEADQGLHLSVSLRDKGWHCWRNVEHRGRRRAPLIQAMLGCSQQRARELADEYMPPPPADEDFGELIAGMLGVRRVIPQTQRLDLLREFTPLGLGVLAVPYRVYLRDRGYDSRDIEWLTEHYELHYARDGDWHHRIIIPIRDLSGRLVNWTARTIRKEEKLRYKTLSRKDVPAALMPTHELLLGLPMLARARNPRVLVVCEGPFDAMRLTLFGARFGVYATCMFGLTASSEQAELLHGLRSLFPRCLLLIDPEAELYSFRMQQVLPVTGLATLPKGVEDPGALPASLADVFIKGLLAA